MPDSDQRSPTWSPLCIPSTAEAQAEIEPAMIGGAIGEMGQAVAEATQTAPTMAALICLGVIATCAQRQLEIAPYGDAWRETLSFWAVALADSGELKSAVMRPLIEPLHEWDKLQRDRWRSKIARNLSEREVAKARIERYKVDAAKAKTPEDREAARKAMEQEHQLMPELLFVPRSLTTDITNERLQQLLAENSERISLFSDEGGQFATLAGLYSSGQAAFDAFLKAYDGSATIVDRAQRKAYVSKPALTMVVMVQPGIFREVADNKRFRHSGLLARFCYGNPAPRVGRRDPRRRAALDGDLVARYRREVIALMDAFAELQDGPRVVTLTDAAQGAFDAYRASIEQDLAAGGKLRGLRDWGSKHAGRVLRVAALIEVARRGPHVKRIDLDTLLDAIGLGNRLIGHALSTFAAAGADEAESDARALMEWVSERRVDRAADELQLFTSSEAQKALEYRFRKVEQLRKAAAVLTSWGVLSAPMSRPNKGARPSTYWLVNPEAFHGRG